MKNFHINTSMANESLNAISNNTTYMDHDNTRYIKPNNLVSIYKNNNNNSM